MSIVAEALVRHYEAEAPSASAVHHRGSEGARGAEGRESEAIAGITYSRTRIVEPDAGLLRNNRVISGFGPCPLVDSYKILSVQTLQRLGRRNGNALAVVSPGEGEGKTLTAINLGLSFAREVDRTVLLVDANLRRPSVHRYFGFVPEVGLSDYLLDGTPLDRILVNPSTPGFVILPGGRPVANSTELLGSAKMERLVQELKNRYPARLVVFDLPPLLSIADALAFSPYVDAAVMVVQERKTRARDVARAVQVLKSVELIGTVLNRAEEATSELDRDPPASDSWWRRLRRRLTNV